MSALQNLKSLNLLKHKHETNTKMKILLQHTQYFDGRHTSGLNIIHDIFSLSFSEKHERAHTASLV